MMKKIKLAIAEDHLLVRQGMIALLKEEEGIELLFAASNGAELLDKLQIHSPDIVLLDIAMPVMDGKEAIERISQQYPAIKVIIITSHYNDKYVTEFLARGAKGFLAKNSDIEVVVEAIYSVYEQGYYFDALVSKSMVEKLISANNGQFPDAMPLLSSREIEVLKLVVQEKNNQEISAALFLSKRTIEWHKKNILVKTNSKNTIGLVKYALKNGIIRSSNDLDETE
jgi:DNA-binding NarL/FixJ family response regulator